MKRTFRLMSVMVAAIGVLLFLVACDESAPGAVCGDGVVESIEACDDGNLTEGDGCDGACGREIGWDCAAGNVCVSVCGDGLVVGPEACDDGNTANEDGCSANCMSDETCGNGVQDVGEVCDDGNTVGGDGCSGNCLSDETCGNGYLDTIQGEECDPGGDNVDGCDSGCMTEEGWQCDYYYNDCRPICGDGLLVGDEHCDDQNDTPGDGCYNCCRTGLPVDSDFWMDYFGFVTDMAVDASHIYWVSSSYNTDDASIVKLSKSGGPAVLLAARDWIGEIEVDSTHVYWTTRDSATGDGTILKMPVGGGPVVELAAGLSCARQIRIDSTHLYWVGCGVAGDEAVMKVALGGGAPTSLVVGFPGAKRGLAIDSSNLYFGAYDGEDWWIRKVPIQGGTAEMFAGPMTAPRGIAIDSTHLYWIESNPSMYSYDAVMRKQLTGGQSEYFGVSHLTDTRGPSGPWVNATHVYLKRQWWYSGAGIVRVSKLTGIEEWFACTWASHIVLGANTVYWSGGDAVLLKQPM